MTKLLLHEFLPLIEAKRKDNTYALEQVQKFIPNFSQSFPKN